MAHWKKANPWQSLRSLVTAFQITPSGLLPLRPPSALPTTVDSFFPLWIWHIFLCISVFFRLHSLTRLFYSPFLPGILLFIQKAQLKIRILQLFQAVICVFLVYHTIAYKHITAGRYRTSNTLTQWFGLWLVYPTKCEHLEGMGKDLLIFVPQALSAVSGTTWWMLHNYLVNEWMKGGGLKTSFNLLNWPIQQGLVGVSRGWFETCMFWVESLTVDNCFPDLAIPGEFVGRSKKWRERWLCPVPYLCWLGGWGGGSDATMRMGTEWWPQEYWSFLRIKTLGLSYAAQPSPANFWGLGK